MTTITFDVKACYKKLLCFKVWHRWYSCKLYPNILYFFWVLSGHWVNLWGTIPKFWYPITLKPMTRIVKFLGQLQSKIPIMKSLFSVTVWPDNGIKSCPIVPNVPPKVVKSFIALLEMAQNFYHNTWATYRRILVIKKLKKSPNLGTLFNRNMCGVPLLALQ